MRKFVLLIPLIYIMPVILSNKKDIAVYMAEPIADFFAVSFTAVLFFFQFRKCMRQIEQNVLNKNPLSYVIFHMKEDFYIFYFSKNIILKYD